MLTPLITLGQVPDAPGGRAFLELHFSADIVTPAMREMRELLAGAFMRVTPALRNDSASRDAFWAELEYT
jgi:hypothetical protein